MVDVQPLPPPRRRGERLGHRGGRLARRQLLVAELHVQTPPGNVQHDPVARAHQTERSARSGLRGDVEDHGAVGGAGHATVADAHHVPHALLEQLGGQRHVGDLGHARIALGAAASQDHDGVCVDLELGIVDPSTEVLDAVEDERPAAVLEQLTGGGGGFDDGAVGREVAAQQGDAGVVLDRALPHGDHLRIEDLRILEVVHERLPRDGQRLRVQQVLDLPQHGQQATGAEEVLHEVATGGLEVHQQWHMGADAVEILHREADAEATGDREQVHHGVGRPADRGERDDRVVEGALGEEGRGGAAVLHQIDGQAPGELGGLAEAGIGGGGARDPGHDGPERLGDQRHRRRGAHGVAVPGAADHRGLRAGEVLQRERPGAHLLAELPHPRAAAQRGAAEGAVEHGPTGHHHRGDVDAGGRHEQGGDGLVAAAQQHHAVDRVGTQHLLGAHRGHVPPEHRGGAHIGLTEGDHRQLLGHAAGLEDPVLDELRDAGQVRVAGGEVAGGVGDRDLGAAAERVVGHSPTHPGAVDVGVAVLARVPLAAAELHC